MCPTLASLRTVWDLVLVCWLDRRWWIVFEKGVS